MQCSLQSSEGKLMTRDEAIRQVADIMKQAAYDDGVTVSEVGQEAGRIATEEMTDAAMKATFGNPKE
jgi:hypothetical protein